MSDSEIDGTRSAEESGDNSDQDKARTRPLTFQSDESDSEEDSIASTPSTTFPSTPNVVSLKVLSKYHNSEVFFEFALSDTIAELKRTLFEGFGKFPPENMKIFLENESESYSQELDDDQALFRSYSPQYGMSLRFTDFVLDEYFKDSLIAIAAKSNAKAHIESDPIDKPSSSEEIKAGPSALAKPAPVDALPPNTPSALPPNTLGNQSFGLEYVAQWYKSHIKGKGKEKNGRWKENYGRGYILTDKYLIPFSLLERFPTRIQAREKIKKKIEKAARDLLGLLDKKDDYKIGVCIGKTGVVADSGEKISVDEPSTWSVNTKFPGLATRWSQTYKDDYHCILPIATFTNEVSEMYFPDYYEANAERCCLDFEQDLVAMFQMGAEAKSEKTQTKEMITKIIGTKSETETKAKAETIKIETTGTKTTKTETTQTIEIKTQKEIKGEGVKTEITKTSKTETTQTIKINTPIEIEAGLKKLSLNDQTETTHPANIIKLLNKIPYEPGSASGNAQEVFVLYVAFKIGTEEDLKMYLERKAKEKAEKKAKKEEAKKAETLQETPQKTAETPAQGNPLSSEKKVAASKKKNPSMKK